LDDQQQLQKIINDTKKLLLLAQEGDWDAVVELEKNRGLAISALFENSPVIDPKLLAEGIQFILDKNELLAQYSCNQRDNLRIEISKAGRAHKAINKYLST